MAVLPSAGAMRGALLVVLLIQSRSDANARPIRRMKA